MSDLGDYDGDTLVVIWLLSIVSKFENADDKYSYPPQGLKLCFETDKETVGDFIERTKSWTSEKRTEAMQVYLLGGLCDPSLVGKYSAMHEFATYTLGYSHPNTIKLNAKSVFHQYLSRFLPNYFRHQVLYGFRLSKNRAPN